MLVLMAGLAASCGPVLEAQESEAPMRAEEQAHGSEEPGGALRFARQITGPGEEIGRIVFDRDGGFLAMVNFNGSTDLGGGPVVDPGAGDSDRFALALARYDGNGRLQWVQVFSAPPGSPGNTFGLALAVDRRRDIVLVLDAAGGVDFGNGQVAAGVLLVKLDSEGRLRWLRPFFEGTGFANVSRLVTDRENNIAVGGFLSGTVDFGLGPVTSGPGGSAYLTKFSPEGTALWTYANTEEQSQGIGVAVDNWGHFLLSGTVSTGIQTDPFVLMLSPEGTVLWERRLEGALGFALSVATHGNRVVVVGTFALTFTFEGRTHTATPNGGILQDAFVVAYTRAGEERWAYNFGFSADDVAMDERDGVVVAGSYQAGSTDLGVLGPLPGNPATVANLYVVKFDRIDGERRWVRGFAAGDEDLGTPGIESASIAVTKQGRSAVLGGFTGTLTVDSEVWEAQGRTDLFFLGFER